MSTVNLSKMLIGPLSMLCAISSPLRTDQTSASTIAMAEQIVADYKALRETCIASDESIRHACYYKLNILTWDFREAKHILNQARPPKDAKASKINANGN